MKGVLESEYGLATREAAGNLHSILNGLRAAVCEEGLFRKLAGRQVIQTFGKLYVRLVHRNMKTGVREAFGLLFHGFNNCVRARANIQTAKPASEINVSVPVNIFYKSAPRRLHENRRNVERPARNSQKRSPAVSSTWK